MTAQRGDVMARTNPNAPAAAATQHAQRPRHLRKMPGFGMVTRTTVRVLITPILWMDESVTGV